MKKIYTNNDDYSFENEVKFSKKLSNKIKTRIIAGALAGTLILSGGTIFKVSNSKNKDSVIISSTTSVSNQNDKIIEDLINKTILVNGATSTISNKYTINNDLLYDDNNNQVNLYNETLPLYLINCNISNELLENSNLSSSKIKKICFDMSSIDDEFVEYLPESLTELSLYKCNYITNLNNLPSICPNITKLYINCMPSLSDLSFVYELSNLKEVYISNSAYVTEDLLYYLYNNNIKTNITKKDVDNAKKIDNIVNNIITNNMSDREKIQSVSLYVLDNLTYDISTIRESNDNPLTLALDTKKGVCTSYAYLTNVLLNKAGINSYNITNDTHSWNIVNLDDKYYHLDNTKIDSSLIYSSLLKTLNISKYYIKDVEETGLNNPLNISQKGVMIPTSIIEKINMNKNVDLDYYGLSDEILAIAAVLATIVLKIKALEKLEKKEEERHRR